MGAEGSIHSTIYNRQNRIQGKQDQKEHFILINGKVFQEDIRILNFLHDYTALEFMQNG